ncbi:MAG: hypothetical protein ABW321_18375, partial [Polyangiales bacterium]
MRNYFAAAALACCVAFSARASAQCADEACVQIGSNLAAIDGKQSALIDALLSSLTGATVDLTQAQGQALSGANVSIENLTAAIRANGLVDANGDPLTTDLTLSQVYDSLADALTATGQTSAAMGALKLAADTAGLTGTVQLSDLIGSTDRTGVSANTSFNALNLIQGTAEHYNVDHVARLNPITVAPSVLNLGIAGLGNVALTFYVVKAPVFVCGSTGARFTSGSVRVRVRAALDTSPADVNLGLIRINLRLTNLDLVVSIGQAEGTIQTVNALASAVNLQVTPGITDIYVGSVSDASFLDRESPIDPESELTWGNIATITLSGTLGARSTTTVDARGHVATTAGSPTSLVYNGPYPQTRTATINGSAVPNLLTTLLANLEIRVNAFTGSIPLTDAISDLVSTLLTSTLRTVGGLLDNVLSGLLTGAVNPALESLGLRIGQVDVTVSRAYQVPVGASCNDGEFCTVNDVCDADDGCVGTARQCDDGLDCTTDSCNEDGDVCTAAVSDGCLIDGECFDVGQVDPLNTCRACVPSSGVTTGFTVLAQGTPCDDDAFCTINDACNPLGFCTGELNPCDDGQSCTLDLCDAVRGECNSTVSVGCLINGACINEGTTDPDNDCRFCAPGSSLIQWSNVTANTPCDDDQFCTTGDACNALGLCIGGPRDCSDPLDCSIDTCNEDTNECVSAATPLLSCIIDNQCYAAGASEPGNPCRTCNPLISATTWSNRLSGFPCEDGQFCTVADTCNGEGVCGGLARSCGDLLDCT